MQLEKHVLSSICLMLGLFGCSDEPASTPQSGTFGEIYTALCETSARCDGVTLAPDSCSLDRACTTNDLDISTRVDGAGTCAKEIRALSCTDYQGPVPDSSACLQAAVSAQRQVGAASEGGGCRDDDGCEFGLLCSAVYYDEACGTCVTPPSEGRACLDFRCGNGLYCDDADTCRNEHALGLACTDSIECVYGAYCIEGTCALPTLGEGDDCMTNDDDCRAPLRCIEGTCKPVAEAGDACGPGQCTFGLSCAEGTCVEVAACGSGASGDGCQSDENCASDLHCDYDLGTCAPGQPAADGADACSSNPARSAGAAPRARLVRPRTPRSALHALLR